MKKDYRKLVIIAFSIGLLLGISMMDDIKYDISSVFANIMFGAYFIFVLLSIAYINQKYQRTNQGTWAYPLLILVMYIPMNLLAGIYLDPRISYYGSFPRFVIIPLYGFALILLYVIAGSINRLLKNRYTKWVFIITDLFSLALIPYVLLATYFVAPA